MVWQREQRRRPGREQAGQAGEAEESFILTGQSCGAVLPPPRFAPATAGLLSTVRSANSLLSLFVNSKHYKFTTRKYLVVNCLSTLFKIYFDLISNSTFDMKQDIRILER